MYIIHKKNKFKKLVKNFKIIFFLDKKNFFWHS